MANEKRLIDANALQRKICGAKCGCEYEDCGCEGDCVFDCFISNAPTVDAVEVCYCDSCVNHGNCLPEDIFRMARIEKPYCCAGKMDGDGNG